MKKIITRLRTRHILPLGCVTVADAVVFGAVNPRTAPSILLVVGFLLFVMTSYYMLKGLLAVPGLYGLSIRHKQRLLRILTVLAGTLTALQSIGQLGSRDVLVLALLSVLLYLYISYAKSMRQNLRTNRP